MYFPMTPKEGPELSYIILYIIKSPHGIIIDQIDHMKATTTTQGFPDATERVNPATTPFKAEKKFELSLAETLPHTPVDLHHL